MPLFKQNVKDDFDKMLWYMIQTKLGEEAHGRTLDTLQKQFEQQEQHASTLDRLMRERSAIDEREAIEKSIRDGLMKAATENTGINYLTKTAQVLAASGKAEEAEPIYKRILEISVPYIKAESNAFAGAQTADDIMAILQAGGTGAVETAISQAGQQKRAGMTAKTAAEALAQREKEFEAKGAEVMPEEGKIDDTYFKKWNPIVNDRINFLESIIKDKNVSRYADAANYILTQLSMMQEGLANGEKLSEDQVKILREAKDLKKITDKYKKQELYGQEQYGGPEAALTRQTDQTLDIGMKIRALAQKLIEKGVPATDAGKIARKYYGWSTE